MILEIFSCSGGMAEGLRRAGLKPDMAIDFDTDACESYERNLGHRPIQIDARDLLRMVRDGWSPGPVDLLVADPPCTPWSRAGKRLGEDDDRDMLGVTVDLVREIRPRAALIANVPGLDDEPNWPVVQRTIGGLARDGYCVIDFARLDAASFGVPQRRIRPFWYCHRGGRCIDWPRPTHAHPDACGPVLPGITDRLRPWVTCREALAHLPADAMGSRVALRWHNTPRGGLAPRATHLDEVAHVVTTKDSAGDGNIIFDGPVRPMRRGHPSSRLDEPALSVPASRPGNGAILVNDRHPINRADKPSHTVTAKGNGRGAQGACVIEWPRDSPSSPNAIKLSERAAAILQGFPDAWQFCGKTKRSRWSQIGMAMPPPMAEAVGRAIASALFAGASP